MRLKRADSQGEKSVPFAVMMKYPEVASLMESKIIYLQVLRKNLYRLYIPTSLQQ